jgi:TonB family protein
VSENRFLQSFCALVGAAILVCGMHLFLLATADRHSPTDSPIATATQSIELSTGSTPAESVADLDVARGPVDEEPDPRSQAPQFTASTQEQPQIIAEARVGDHARFALASATISLEPTPKDESAVSEFTPEVTSPMPGETAEHGTEDVGDDNTDSAPPEGDAVAPEGSSEIPQPHQPTASPQQIAEAAQLQPPEPAGDSPIVRPNQQASSQETEAAQPQQSDQATDGVEKKTSIQIAAVEPKPKQPRPQVSLPQGAPKAMTEKASRKLTAKEKAAPKLAAKEKTSPKLAAKAKAAPKAAAKPDQRQKVTSQVTPRWKPMGLAPADKPSISLIQGQPKKPSVGGYNAEIWSALARKKPSAGQHGSTTVTFAIGAGGALRFVRVSQSSGNARLDQLALATVRNAAPFPRPPVLKAGTAAYTIRIDLH